MEKIIHTEKYIKIFIPIPDDYDYKDREVLKTKELLNDTFGLVFFELAKNKIKLLKFYTANGLYPHIDFGAEFFQKGLGKDLLCKAIRYLLRETDYTPETIITLDASGVLSDTICLLDKTVIEKYRHDHAQELSKIKEADRLKMIFKLYKHDKLVDYYKRYGFSVVYSIPLCTNMKTTLGKVFDHCTEI
jgi:hypothetical protein